MVINIGRHFGTSAEGEMMAEVTETGNVDIWIEFDNPNKKGMPAIGMTPEQWDRLVAWVEWQRRDRGLSNVGIR